MLMLMSILMFFGEVFRIVKAMLLGFPPEFRVTVYVRKFFPFPLWKRFRKTGIPERFFFVKRKFPERCPGITDRYGIPERSGTIGTIITLKSYICKYNTS